MATPRKLDFNEKPYIVIWETTQACDLACVHCRACAQPQRNPFELSTAEAKGLIDQIAEMKVPVFVLTGGDPLKRPDIHELVQYAHQRGVHTSMTPSATPLLTKEAIARLKQGGLARLAVSLDGSTAEIHDAFRRAPVPTSGRSTRSAGPASSVCRCRSIPPSRGEIWTTSIPWCGCCRGSTLCCGASSSWCRRDAARPRTWSPLKNSR